jgi:hypothetical protein
MVRIGCVYPEDGPLCTPEPPQEAPRERFRGAFWQAGEETDKIPPPESHIGGLPRPRPRTEIPRLD